MKSLIHNNQEYAFVTERDSKSYWRNINDGKDELVLDVETVIDKKGKKTKQQKIEKVKIKERIKWL